MGLTPNNRFNISVINVVIIMTLLISFLCTQVSTLKIIEIGMGCSGTRSLYHFFEANSFESIAWSLDSSKIIAQKGYLDNLKRYHSDSVRLYDLLLLNYQNDMPMLHGIPSYIQYIGDLKIGHFGLEEDRLGMMKALHRQNSNATFIILTRPLSHWLHCMVYSFSSKK
eukprot:457788_1